MVGVKIYFFFSDKRQVIKKIDISKYFEKYFPNSNFGEKNVWFTHLPLDSWLIQSEYSDFGSRGPGSMPWQPAFVFPGSAGSLYDPGNIYTRWYFHQYLDRQYHTCARHIQTRLHVSIPAQCSFLPQKTLKWPHHFHRAGY